MIGTDYMEDMIEYFETYGGYQRNVNIRAAPYDWRMATDHPQMENFWVQVNTQRIFHFKNGRFKS